MMISNDSDNISKFKTAIIAGVCTLVFAAGLGLGIAIKTPNANQTGVSESTSAAQGNSARTSSVPINTPITAESIESEDTPKTVTTTPLTYTDDGIDWSIDL